jgi:DNA uptake protein ComE-like DNA-binding protein
MQGITMSVQIFRCLLVIFLLALVCTGCSRENPQDLKQKTAHTTAELKRDAKAVASGIKEGWGQYKTQDVNTATKEQLMTLPGVTAAEANRIIAGRPYNRTDDLVTRHILSKKEYDKIADLLKVGKR